MKKKILITGFPHTGTSILKSKIGECSNVWEFPYETPIVKPEYHTYAGDKEFILVKYPMLPIEIRANNLIKITKDSIYDDYIIIFVLRNPWNVYNSIIKAGGNPLNNLPPNSGNNDYYFKVSEYEASAQHFLEAQNKELYPNLYCIKYEDFFPNNFEKLKELFDSIGLEYTDDIFYNRSKDYIHWDKINLKDIDNSNVSYTKDRYEYRTWQINQSFKNMNGEVNIPDELSDILKNSNIIRELGYTDPRITD
ncbi:MAG: Sulfotransferase domain [Bacteroidota bacterium]